MQSVEKGRCIWMKFISPCHQISTETLVCLDVRYWALLLKLNMERELGLARSRNMLLNKIRYLRNNEFKTIETSAHNSSSQWVCWSYFFLFCYCLFWGFVWVSLFFGFIFFSMAWCLFVAGEDGSNLDELYKNYSWQVFVKFFKTSGDWDPLTSLGSLFQWLP